MVVRGERGGGRMSEFVSIAVGVLVAQVLVGLIVQATTKTAKTACV